MAIRQELHVLVDDILGDDPRRALIAYRILADDHLPWLEQRVVALARREKWSWGKISRLLLRSRQAVFEKHRVPSIALPKHRPKPDQATQYLWRHYGKDARFRKECDVPW